MKNFSFEHNGKTFWYSRSLACNLIIFLQRKDGHYYVLMNKRGEGCEFNQGLWNVPGGFIDFDEDAIDCAIRETKEECGVDISRFDVNFYGLETEPRGQRQTMVAIHYAVVKEENARFWVLKQTGGEKDEVSQVSWLDMEDICVGDRYQFVPRQRQMIAKVFKDVKKKGAFKKPFWKRLFS